MAKANNIDTLDKSKIVSATHHPDGSLATVIIKESDFSTRLIQYSPEGNVVFSQELKEGGFRPEDVTYHKDGTIASITRENLLFSRTVTLYDENARVTTSIELNEHDQVNFKDGVLSSVIKYTGSSFFSKTDMDETQYGPDGKIIASVHKVRQNLRNGYDNNPVWLTTSETTYYPNGHKASTITYKQRTKVKRTGEDLLISDNCEKNVEADSYRSSIIQYDENGKIVVSLKLNEQDEVNYNGNKIATVIRRDQDGNTLSVTTYEENGRIASLQNYDKAGNVVSSTSYENSRPVSGSQVKGKSGYENIFSLPQVQMKPTVKKRKQSLKKRLNEGSKKGVATTTKAKKLAEL